MQRSDSASSSSQTVVLYSQWVRHPDPATTTLMPVRSLRAVVDKLSNIIKTHKSWDDNLSVWLKSWGKKTVTDLLNTQITPNKALKNFARAIYDLYLKVLVSPMDSSPMKSILLVNNDDVWSNWMLVHYQDLAKRLGQELKSPFTGEPMEEIPPHLIKDGEIVWPVPVDEGEKLEMDQEKDRINIRPHEFAEAILAWAQPDAPLDYESIQSEDFLDRETQVEVEDNEEEEDKYKQYLFLANIFNSRKALRNNISTPITEDTDDMLVQWRTGEEAVAQLAEFHAQSNALHSEEMRESFQVLRGERERVYGHLNSENTRLLGNCSELNEEVAKLEAKSLEQEARYNHLLVLDAAKAQQIRELQNRPPKSGRCLVS